MVALVQADLPRLLEAQQGTCLSLYQPTHRKFPDSRQNPTRYKNLLKELQRSLSEQYSAKDAEVFLRPFEQLLENREFWDHPQDGLAVFGAPDFFGHYWLPRPVPELAIVAGSFHVKPLVRILQTADSYQVLALSRDQIRFYEGNRDALDPVEPAPGVPRTIVDALGDELTEPYSKVSSYGSGRGAPMHHGHGSKKDEVDGDTERYFRAVDKAILEHHSEPSQLPLVLAALPEYQGHFRQLSRNPFLLNRGLPMDVRALSVDALRGRAWEIVADYHHGRTRALIEEYATAAAKGLGSDDLNEAAGAALTGRVAALIVEADRHIGGRLDPHTGQVALDSTERPDVDDVLDDIAVAVMRSRGKVTVVPKSLMPSDSGLAVIYRY